MRCRRGDDRDIKIRGRGPGHVRPGVFHGTKSPSSALRLPGDSILRDGSGHGGSLVLDIHSTRPPSAHHDMHAEILHGHGRSTPRALPLESPACAAPREGDKRSPQPRQPRFRGSWAWRARTVLVAHRVAPRLSRALGEQACARPLLSRPFATTRPARRWNWKERGAAVTRLVTGRRTHWNRSIAHWCRCFRMNETRRSEDNTGEGIAGTSLWQSSGSGWAHGTGNRAPLP